VVATDPLQQESYPILNESTLNNMPWLTDDLSPWMNRIPQKLPINMLKVCHRSMHPSIQPLFKSISKQSCWHGILHHLKQRGQFLFHQDDKFVLEQLISVHLSLEISSYTCISVIRIILCAKYGEDIISEVSQAFLTRKQHINACTKSLYHTKKNGGKNDNFQTCH
jgi:hypothetical protein